MAEEKPTVCISNEARSKLMSALQRLDTCDVPAYRPVIERTKYGEAILDIEGIPQRKYNSLHALAEHFPGGAYRNTKEKEGPLKYEGHRVATDAFERAMFPNGVPFSHVYTVTKEKRKGVPVVVITNERPNPEYVQKPTSKKPAK